VEAFREALSSFLRSSVQRASARVLPFFPSSQQHSQSSISLKLSEVPEGPESGGHDREERRSPETPPLPCLIGWARGLPSVSKINDGDPKQ